MTGASAPPRPRTRAPATPERSNTSHAGTLSATGVNRPGRRVRSASRGCPTEPGLDQRLNRTGDNRWATEDAAAAARLAGDTKAACHSNRARRRRRALPTTDSELRLMAALVEEAPAVPARRPSA